ncbi:GD25193 [Drosophila simulans]|nr:GD25193 [Drosophila simulans]
MSRLLDENCGISKEDPYDPRITVGNRTNIYENPWMVLVSSSKMCGGSLITRQLVLTAAHCVFPEKMYVRLGNYETVNPEPYCVNNHCIPRFYNISVDLKIVHEKYNECLQNDIALLRMSEAVEYSDYVRPICILVDEQMPSAQNYTVTGWGKTESGKFSRILLNATLYNLDISKCKEKYEKPVDRSQICAASHISNTCRGDSGGPLSSKFCYDNKLLTFQYGLVSYGAESCEAYNAGVNTNVSYHTEWILRAVQNMDYFSIWAAKTGQDFLRLCGNSI